MTKEKIIETINSLPADFKLEELIERLLFINEIEEGLAQIDRGEFKTQEEVKQLVKSWQR